jgi:hypothetical protein
MTILFRYALIFSVCSLMLFAQDSHRRPLPDIPPENVPTVQRRTVDPAQLKREAEELFLLAQSIPTDVDKLGKGLHPKDLDQKLKRLEKLSKQLRRNLSP